MSSSLMLFIFAFGVNPSPTPLPPKTPPSTDRIIGAEEIQKQRKALFEAAEQGEEEAPLRRPSVRQPLGDIPDEAPRTLKPKGSLAEKPAMKPIPKTKFAALLPPDEVLRAILSDKPVKLSQEALAAKVSPIENSAAPAAEPATFIEKTFRRVKNAPLCFSEFLSAVWQSRLNRDDTVYKCVSTNQNRCEEVAQEKAENEIAGHVKHFEVCLDLPRDSGGPKLNKPAP